MAIIGFVLSFMVPIAGLIISMIGLQQIKKRHEDGRVLAIAGIIVSAVTIILTVLVFVFVFMAIPSISRQSRDSVQKNDINVASAELVSYFSQKRIYPTNANLSDSSWRSSNLPGMSSSININSQEEPKESGVASSFSSVTYKATGTNGEPCNNAKINCTKYTLSITLEDGSLYQEHEPGLAPK